MSDRTSQLKTAVDVLLDSFDDATDAADAAAMAALMPRLRSAFAAYRGACAEVGVEVDAQTVADCRAASETLRRFQSEPTPIRPAPARPLAQPAHPVDEDSGATYGGAWRPPDDDDMDPPPRRPAPARPSLRQAAARPAPTFEDEEAPLSRSRPGGREEDEDIEGGQLIERLAALTEDRRKLFALAGGLAALVVVFLWNPVVAILLAGACLAPVALRVRRTPSGSDGPPLAVADEDHEEAPRRLRRRR